MKVMSYSYMPGGRYPFLQQLYVDGDLDSSLLHQRIIAIIDGQSGTVCKESVIKGFGVKAEEQFREQGYFDPCRFITEFEGEL